MLKAFYPLEHNSYNKISKDLQTFLTQFRVNQSSPNFAPAHHMQVPLPRIFWTTQNVGGIHHPLIWLLQKEGFDTSVFCHNEECLLCTSVEAAEIIQPKVVEKDTQIFCISKEWSSACCDCRRIIMRPIPWTRRDATAQLPRQTH